MDDVDLGQGGESVQLGLKLTQAGLRLFEGCGDTVGRSLKASVLFALVALSLASLCRFVFPLISTVFHFGALAHDVFSASTPMARGHGGTG